MLKVILEPADEGGYTVHVPSLPGCISEGEMVEEAFSVVPLHRLAQIMGHDSLDTTMLYIRGTKQDLQQDVEKIAWI
jgi:hypothetical protein